MYRQTAYTLLPTRLCLGSRRRSPSARTSGAQVSALLTRSDYGRSYRFYTYIERKTYRQRVEGEKYWRRVLAQARTPLASLRSITSTPVAGVGVRVALAERVGVFPGKWTRELDYRLIKELWAVSGDRIAVRFAYEWHDDSAHWFRSYGNENWEFDSDGLMRRRYASINDLPIGEAERKYLWPLGRRPDDHPGLSDLAL